jgi:indolepyruvate ferredoxin oxidoreductase
MAEPDAFSLDAKYTLLDGTILLSGVQALVRLPLDQLRADRRAGLNTAGLISGYRGSPLAGLDRQLQRNAHLLRAHQLVFMPGVNEDAAATMIMGSQLANLLPQPKYDGVIGVWYGKGPGVDRSGDAFKHANFAGVGRYGGVLALAGDDVSAKSSTIPSGSEVALYDALMPILVPGTVQEVLDFGRLGFELSRYCGLWVGFKIATNLADEFGTAAVGLERVAVARPEFLLHGRPWQPTQNPNLMPPFTAPIEQEIYTCRLEAARLFGAANRLNRVTLAPQRAWLGIAAAGKTYYEVRQALADLGLDDAALDRYGIRLLQVGMLFPLAPEVVRQFALGLEEIVIVEEKRALLELFIRDALYHLAERPRVVGKRDEQERPCIPADGELDADRLAPVLAARLAHRIPPEVLAGRLAFLRAQRDIPVLALAAGSAQRQPYYCSGCPHNRSTVLPEGALGGAGIGCHTMALTMDRGHIGITQMGGEGAQWAGAAPFSGTPHMFQNLGDGTLFHSGSLAIRQAVAAGTNITYKILFNNAVGMTGGQAADGAISVPALTRALDAEGVQRIIVTTDQPEKYPRDARWAPGVEVWDRDRLDAAQRVLQAIPGVTVLIHDQTCAAELRRLRKRGKAPEPATRVFINPAVCEGCGDCGAKSNCLSVQPVATEFGRKTTIHQSSCNKDYSCLQGDCPAFVTVEPSTKNREPQQRERFLVLGSRCSELSIPEPSLPSGDACNVYMMGIGGTGVVTINQVLGTAAVLDGKYVVGLDQTGLSQKGGPVVSHLKITAAPLSASSKIAAGQADCFLAFDILTATAAQNLTRAEAGRTVAVISTSQVPTGGMVAATGVHFPPLDTLVARIAARTRAAANVCIDAQALAQRAFGDHMAANMIVLGAACQAGALPVRAESIERAIALNGVAVRMNTDAFRLGRRAVADPVWLRSALQEHPSAVQASPARTSAAQAIIDTVGAVGELQRLLEIRIPELIAYQNVAYARQYADFVRTVRVAEQAAVAGQTRLSEAVARYLFKLMAYKDEYEVARLHLTAGSDQALEAAFGPIEHVHYLLHPPLLRAIGWKKKLKLGRWFESGFRTLVALKRLRGTSLDIFGYARVRRVERALIGEYRGLIEQTLGNLDPATYVRAVQLAELPDMIRGYEQIKLRGVERFRAAARELLEA